MVKRKRDRKLKYVLIKRVKCRRQDNRKYRWLRRPPKTKKAKFKEQFVARRRARGRISKVKKVVRRSLQTGSKTKKQITALRRPFVLTPLQFRRQTRDVTRSENEIARNLAEMREIRRERYRLLEGRTEALTNLFPELMHQIMLTKFNEKTHTPQAAQKLLESIY